MKTNCCALVFAFLACVGTFSASTIQAGDFADGGAAAAGVAVGVQWSMDSITGGTWSQLPAAARAALQGTAIATGYGPLRAGSFLCAAGLFIAKEVVKHNYDSLNANNGSSRSDFTYDVVSLLGLAVAATKGVIAGKKTLDNYLVNQKHKKQALAALELAEKLKEYQDEKNKQQELINKKHAGVLQAILKKQDLLLQQQTKANEDSTGLVQRVIALEKATTTNKSLLPVIPLGSDLIVPSPISEPLSQSNQPNAVPVEKTKSDVTTEAGVPGASESNAAA